ncbi:hypothetical protein D1872_199510 [compost metagenome]
MHKYRFIFQPTRRKSSRTTEFEWLPGQTFIHLIHAQLPVVKPALPDLPIQLLPIYNVANHFHSPGRSLQKIWCIFTFEGTYVYELAPALILLYLEFSGFIIKEGWVYPLTDKQCLIHPLLKLTFSLAQKHQHIIKR